MRCDPFVLPLRIKALLEKTGSSDPVKEMAEAETLEFLKEKLQEDPSLLKAVENGQPLSVSLTGDAAKELTKEDLKRLLSQAISELLKTQNDT